MKRSILGAGLVILLGAGCAQPVSSPSTVFPPESPTESSTAGVTASATTTSPGASASPTVQPSSPATKSSSGSPGPGSGSVAGTVVVDPECREATPPCGAPSYPLNGGLVQAKQSGRVAAYTRTADDGSYRLSLAAGRYTLVVSGGHAPGPSGSAPKRCTPVVVDVTAGRETRGDVGCVS